MMKGLHMRAFRRSGKRLQLRSDAFVEESREEDAGSVRITTDTNQARWTMKLTRTTPWWPIR